MAGKKSRQNTYDRIIDASLTLFNEEGERKISTNHISAHLGISPGNLYYHFCNKDQIIIQIFKRYRHDLSAFLKENPELEDSTSTRYFHGKVFDIMWNYRFLFRDINSLTDRSPELRDEYNVFMRDYISPLISGHLRKMVERGMLVMDDLDIEIFMINYWIVIKHWFAFEASIGQNVLQSISKQRGVRQLMGMVRPYVVKEMRAEFDQVLSELNV